jgi:phosphatidate cytidylyltransferase
MTITSGESGSPKWSDLGVRTGSSLILVPAVLADIWIGGIWFIILTTFLGVLTAFEWSKIAHGGDERQFAVLALAALFAGFLPGSAGLTTALIALLVLGVASNAMVSAGKSQTSMWQRLGVAYVGLPVLALTMLRDDAVFGARAIIWLMLVVWSADILAYFAGRIIGGPRLAPILSPKKTWAGLGGAVAGAALASAIFASATLSGKIWPLVVLAAALGVVEQAGDIFESALKRYHGLKDSGDLIPGHGGIIDRIDGLIAAAVVAWLLGLVRDAASPAAGLLAW